MHELFFNALSRYKNLKKLRFKSTIEYWIQDTNLLIKNCVAELWLIKMMLCYSEMILSSRYYKIQSQTTVLKLIVL